MAKRKAVKPPSDEAPELLARAAAASRSALLQGARQLQGLFEIRSPSVEQGIGDFRIGTSHQHSTEGKTLRAMVEFEFETPFPLEAEERPAVFIKTTFELVYSLDREMPTEEVSAFAAINGIYNSWPYFREFVQSSVARMGLPTMALPLLRPEQAARMAGRGAGSAEASSGS